MNLKKKSMIAGLISAAIIIPASTGVSFANTNEQTKSVDYRTIKGNSVNFRQGPGTNYSSIGKLNTGDKVEYIETVGSWTKIKYNGTEGFVHSDYVSGSTGNEEDNTVKGNKQVTGNSVNFRQGPGTSYSVIKTLNKGTQVGVISESNGWSKISCNGTVGYISSQYLGDINSGGGQEDNTVKENKQVTASSVNFRQGPGTNYSVIRGGGQEDNTVKENKQVTASSVNFRQGPGTNYSVIRSLSRGTQVGVISESNGWSKINYNGTIGYVSSQYLGTVDSGGGENPGQSSSADKVINIAKQQLGKTYVWGAEGPNTFDCSGFTLYSFKNGAGVNLPRVSKEQSKYGTSVSKSNLQKGDLVFFDTDGDGVVNHVGIYIGNNEFIHASSGAGKVVISQFNSYYNSKFTNARRVL